MARGGGKAPKNATWVICVVLYLFALASHFGIVNLGGALASWAWIVGYAVLLIAVRVRGL